MQVLEDGSWMNIDQKAEGSRNVNGTLSVPATTLLERNTHRFEAYCWFRNFSHIDIRVKHIFGSFIVLFSLCFQDQDTFYNKDVSHRNWLQIWNPALCHLNMMKNTNIIKFSHPQIKYTTMKREDKIRTQFRNILIILSHSGLYLAKNYIFPMINP